MAESDFMGQTSTLHISLSADHCSFNGTDDGIMVWMDSHAAQLWLKKPSWFAVNIQLIFHYLFFLLQVIDPNRMERAVETVIEIHPLKWNIHSRIVAVALKWTLFDAKEWR